MEIVASSAFVTQGFLQVNWGYGVRLFVQIIGGRV